MSSGSRISFPVNMVHENDLVPCYLIFCVSIEQKGRECDVSGSNVGSMRAAGSRVTHKGVSWRHNISKNYTTFDVNFTRLKR